MARRRRRQCAHERAPTVSLIPGLITAVIILILLCTFAPYVFLFGVMALLGKTSITGPGRED